MRTICAATDALSASARVTLNGVVQPSGAGITFASEHAGYLRRLVRPWRVVNDRFVEEEIVVGDVQIDFPDLSVEEVTNLEGMRFV
jgi:hypothetical protein